MLIDAVVNNEPVLTVVPAFKAKLAVTANDELTVEPGATVTGNVEPSPLVKVIILLTALAVTNNELVLTVVPAFKANEAVTAKLADVAFNAYEALTACEAEVALSALEAVISKLLIVFPKPSCSSLPLICVIN